MLEWHHQLDGHEFEQALGVDYRQRSLASYSPWGCKVSDTTEQLKNSRGAGSSRQAIRFDYNNKSNEKACQRNHFQHGVRVGFLLQHIGWHRVTNEATQHAHTCVVLVPLSYLMEILFKVQIVKRTGGDKRNFLDFLPQLFFFLLFMYQACNEGNHLDENSC